MSSPITSPQKISLRRSISQRRASFPRHCIWASVMISFQPFSGIAEDQRPRLFQPVERVQRRRISAIRAEAAIAATRSARARSTSRSFGRHRDVLAGSPVKNLPAAVCSSPVELPFP